MASPGERLPLHLDEVTKLQLIRRKWGLMSTFSRMAGPAVAARTSDGLTPLICDSKLAKLGQLCYGRKICLSLNQSIRADSGDRMAPSCP